MTDPALLTDLLALVSPSERGDPMSPLRWTCKGLRRLASERAMRDRAQDQPHRRWRIAQGQEV